MKREKRNGKTIILKKFEELTQKERIEVLKHFKHTEGRLFYIDPQDGKWTARIVNLSVWF